MLCYRYGDVCYNVIIYIGINNNASCKYHLLNDLNVLLIVDSYYLVVRTYSHVETNIVHARQYRRCTVT